MLYLVLWPPKLLQHLRLAVLDPLVLMDSIGLTMPQLPWPLLQWNWVGLIVLLTRLGKYRWRVAHPLLMMDAIGWGVLHHPRLLQRLAVVGGSLMLRLLLSHVRLAVVGRSLMLWLLLRLEVVHLHLVGLLLLGLGLILTSL